MGIQRLPFSTGQLADSTLGEMAAQLDQLRAQQCHSTCANVDVNIQNGTPDTVKVTKFEYFDTTQNAFLPKNLLGASGQQELQSGTVHRATRNFAQVGGRTKFRVTYQHKQGINNFAAPVRVTTDRFVCIDGSTHPVLLDK